MLIRLQADDLGYGILLSGIGTHDEALHLQEFFASKSLKSVVNSAGKFGFSVLVRGLSREAFEHVIGSADVELI
jgi:hypothetical protein